MDKARLLRSGSAAAVAMAYGAASIAAARAARLAQQRGETINSQRIGVDPTLTIIGNSVPLRAGPVRR